MNTKKQACLIAFTFAIGIGTGILGHRYISPRLDESIVSTKTPADGILSPQSASTPPGLYTDDEARNLVKKWKAIDSHDETLLEVVPNGTSAPLLTVLGALGVDQLRLGEPKKGGANFVVYLTWRLSPSFDLSCMTALNDTLNDELRFLDTRRRVYGVRITKRAELASQR